MGRRSKTNPQKLSTLSRALEKWCDANAIEWKKCSAYQWNVTVPQVEVIIAVYPGSGVMWVPKAHYTGTGAIDQSSTKRSFGTKEELIKQLQEVIFAADRV